MRNTIRRPPGPATRIRNPLSLKKPRTPIVVERTGANETLPKNINIPRGDGVACAIVGNAQSILNQEAGILIDAHEMVVRINNPNIINPVCQGTKCNILFATPTSLRQLPRRKNRHYQIVDVGSHLADFFESWSDTLRQDVGCDKARPTTGFIAIAYMVELGYSVKLFGFDWFKTPTLSTHPTNHNRLNVSKPDIPTLWKHHYPQWEEQTVKALLYDAMLGTK